MVLKFIIDHEIFEKMQSDSDCKIIPKAIKRMQKIRNKQARWSWGFLRRWRKVRYDRHQAPKKHSVYCFVEREKMDGILTEQNLEMLAAVFRQEIIIPSIVQSMSNEKIERLGVTAIGDRVWLRELCKEDEENNSRSSFGSRSVGSASTNRTDDVP